MLTIYLVQFSSVAQSCLTLWDPMDCSITGLAVHHQLPKAWPSSQWYHPTILSSVVPFSSCPQFFSASVSFRISQHFTSGGQSIGVSALASVLPMNTQDSFPLGQTGWISLQSKGLSRVFSKPQFKSINSSVFRLLHSPTLTSVQEHRKNSSLE